MTEARWIIFYDGHCGFCHWNIRFILMRDTQRVFSYAPLQGTTCQNLMDEDVRRSLPDSLVLRSPHGHLTTKSQAILKILSQLPSPYPKLSHILQAIPLFFRDSAYDFTARIRHRLVSRPRDICPIVPESYRELFLN